MKLSRIIPILAILVMTLSGCKQGASKVAISEDLPSPYDYALVLHGGAGNMNFQNVPEAKAKQAMHFANKDALVAELKEALLSESDNKVVLVKGSRSQRMEEVVEQLLIEERS